MNNLERMMTEKYVCSICGEVSIPAFSNTYDGLLRHISFSCTGKGVMTVWSAESNLLYLEGKNVSKGFNNVIYASFGG